MDNIDKLTNCVSEVLKICFSGTITELKKSVQKLLLVDSPELNKFNNESNKKLSNKYNEIVGINSDVNMDSITNEIIGGESLNISGTSDTKGVVGSSNSSSGKVFPNGDSMSRGNNTNHIYLTSLELSALEFIRDSKKHCVAHIAAAGGNLEILQTILTSLPNLAHVEDENGENPLFYSIRSLNNYKVDTDYGNSSQYSKERNGEENSSLNNKLDCLLLLIGQCGVNCMNKNGASALHVACELGDAKIAKILIENNANVNIYSDTLGTPLSVSVARGYHDILELLLESGADPNITGKSSDDRVGVMRCPPPIVFASSTGQLEVVRKLLKRGADVDIGDDQGWTPLHCASESGYLEIVKLLIKHNANPNIKIEDKNPYYLAVYNGHIEIAEYLKQYTDGSDIITFVHNTNANINSTEEDVVEDAEIKEDELDSHQIEEYKRLVIGEKEAGNELVRVKDYEKATTTYTKALTMCPVGPNFNELRSILYSNRSFTNLKLKKYKEALEDSQQSIKLSPNWSKAYLRLANVYRDMGEIVDYLHNLFQAFVKDSENMELKKLFQNEFKKYRGSK